MSEHDNNLASDLSVGGNRKPNRKEPKQISFRVNEGEYEKLRSSAETLNMSVPSFVKKKAQGSRLVAPKLDKETRQSIAKDLGSMGANVNQIAKWFNQHKNDTPHYHAMDRNIREVRRRLDDIWQSLN
ncbi:plasmid mobilization relaxosome protein MobC [Staphylococcus saprophyticus]|nr:plasmid mobilization relaxosome protein MobC [Staphylococcus saprophyticus]